MEGAVANVGGGAGGGGKKKLKHSAGPGKGKGGGGGGGGGGKKNKDGDQPSAAQPRLAILNLQLQKEWIMDERIMIPCPGRAVTFLCNFIFISDF